MDYDWTKAYVPFVDEDGEVEVKKDEAAASNASLACSHDHSSERAIYDLKLEEKIEKMQKFLHRGNDFFEEGQYDRAYLQYRSMLTYYEYTFPEEDEGWKLIGRMRFTCNLNAAAAALKLPGMHQEAMQNCYEALQKEPGNVKALYRRAQVCASFPTIQMILTQQARPDPYSFYFP
jgi:tetratricopeptide (TPR) repeat protein